MLKKLRRTVANIISPGSNNSISLPRQFLKFGDKAMHPDWSQVVMSDKDLYTGYGYAAIRKRANKTARLASEGIRTKSISKKEGFEHPYMGLISSSPTFTDYQFWYNISTYLDLEGVYYLMAVRNFDENRYGSIQQFKMLSPYDIHRVINVKDGTFTVGGYIENRKGYTREFPPQMIIEMRQLNPFDDNEPMAMSDAAKESQFTIKTAGDYTRHTLKHNLNAPGIMSTDVILEDTEFDNFVSRVKSHTKGEPIFGNGKGAINWNDMNINLKDAGLQEINEINRETLFAVTGMSKTAMGIEQSGVTRESSKVQKDMINEDEIMPQIQTIIDALNQDYRNNYPKEYKTTEAEIIVENPNASDHDAEIKDTESKQKKADLYSDMVAQGYDPKKAADYIAGRIDIDDLGVPKNPKLNSGTQLSIKREQLHDHELDEKKNEIGDDRSGLVQGQEGALQNAVVNIDQQIVAEAISRIKKKVTNATFEDEGDIITKTEKRKLMSELELVLIGFYGVMMQFQGSKNMRKRAGQYALPGIFTLDKVAKDYIKDISEKVAESHVSTVLDDILVATREAALQGKGQAEIIRNIQKKYNKTITETRAKAIARTETNRAFTRTQYEADRQFIKQNKLQKRAYKKWRTRSGNPCPFCLSLSKGPLIPFTEAFAELGSEIEVDGKTLPVNFEELQAGNAHTNCSCEYELVLLAE